MTIHLYHDTRFICVTTDVWRNDKKQQMTDC